MAAFRLLTKKEKAWFFLLCGYQPKINPLIFLIFIRRYRFNLRWLKVCHQSETSQHGWFFSRSRATSCRVYYRSFLLSASQSPSK
ncbi:hypothetical protein E2L00_09885 [Cedecea colo]|uniref:Uncharacterized protein n=1 Tax=Cedecea colo TaxID=2552946 RepID=A0ABX0VNM9_9ENTR|nr:hypothetical protein [Cedecea colo]